jgi:hypothetical protein
MMAKVGRGFPLSMFSTQLIEHVMHPLQRAVISPKIKIAMDRALRWKIFRDRSPLTASRENVHQRCHRGRSRYRKDYRCF